MDLLNKNVVVTGGSAGIGEKLAEAFAAAGANVLVVARSGDKLDAVAERIGGHSLVADLGTTEGVDGLVARCLTQLDHIDVWVNNAGIETNDAFVATDRDLVRSLARLNFEAPLLLTHDVVNHMLSRGSGHVVQMSSVAGTIPFPGLTAYAGSKAGLTNFTESLRVELAGTPIGLTVIAPGPVDTAMWDRLDDADNYPEPALTRFRRLQFLPKLAPEKIASATVAAVQKDKRFVRLPARYGLYHMLNNAPRRLVEGALVGVKLPLPNQAEYAMSAGAVAAEAGDWEPIWATDNPPSKDWPLYTRGNIGEVFPEVVLPLTWDLYGPRAEAGWRGAYRDMGLLMPGDFADTEPMTILGVFGGYGYINASFVRVLGVRAPGGTVETIDSQFFGESDAPPYRPKDGDKNLRSTARLAKTVFRLLGTKELPALMDDKADAAAYVAAYPGDGATDAELLDYFENLAPLFERLFQRHIDNTFSVALLSGALADLLAKVDKADTLVSILGGIGDIESAAPSSAMWKLARAAAADPTINAEFDAGIDDLVPRLVAHGDETANWMADFGAFLEEFGSRGPNEWDIGSDPWAFRHELALAAIGRMRAADPSHDPARQAERLAAERTAAVEDVRRALNPADRFQFDKALRATTVYSQGRERSKTTIIHAIHGARRAQAELARRMAERGGPSERWKTCLLEFDDFKAAVADPAPHLATIEARVPLYERLASLIPPFIIEGEVPAIETWEPRGTAQTPVAVGEVIQGIAGCPGVSTGIARVVTDAADPRELGPGDVLIAPITDPSWTPLFLAADAVVVDVGATMSHAVIVSRELGIPCVVSATGATSRIPDGATLEVDGSAGTVTILDLPQ